MFNLFLKVVRCAIIVLAGAAVMVNASAMAQSNPALGTDIAIYNQEVQNAILFNNNFKHARAIPEKPLQANGRALKIKSLKPQAGYNLSEIWVDPLNGNDGINDGSEALPFGTIQGAIDNIAPGGTIHLEPGDYSGAIDIEAKSNITIIADQGGVVVIPGGLVSFGVSGLQDRMCAVRVVDSQNINFVGLVFDFGSIAPSAYSGALYWNSSGGFDDCALLNMTGGTATMYLRSLSQTKTVVVKNSQILNPGRIGILAHGALNAIVENCDIAQQAGNVGFGIEIGSTASATIRHNTISGFNTPPAGSSVSGIYVENTFTKSVRALKKVNIIGNEVSNCQYGLYIGNEWNNNAGNVAITGLVSDNIIQNNASGILVTDEDKFNGSSVNLTFKNNSVINNANYGYFIYTNGDGDIALDVTADTISGSVVGVSVDDYTQGAPDSIGPTDSVYRLSFYACSIDTPVGIINKQDDVITAKNNWWGNLRGPAHATNPFSRGSVVSNRVDYAPWVSSTPPSTANFDKDAFRDIDDLDDDNDGFTDIQEIEKGTHPFDPTDMPALVWEFDEDGNMEKWTFFGGLTSEEVKGGLLKAKLTEKNGRMYTNDFAIDAANFKFLEIRYRLTHGSKAKLIWRKSPGLTAASMEFPVIADGLFHVAQVDLSASPEWGGQIISLLFYPTEAMTGELEIDYIRILTNIVPPLAYEFNADNEAEGWQATNSLSEPEVSGGTLKTTITGADPIMVITNPEFVLDAGSYKGVQIRMKSQTGKGASLRWIREDETVLAYTFTTIDDNEFHTYNIDLSGNINWKGEMTYLRFDPNENASSGDIEIDYIRFLDSMPQPAWEFKADGDAEEWAPNRSLLEFEVSGDTLKTTVGGTDPFMANRLVNFPAKTFQYVQVKFKSTKGSVAQLYWGSKNLYSNARGGGHKNFPITSDGLFHVYQIDLKDYAGWNDQIVQLRLDPTVTSSDSNIEVDYIRVLTRMVPPAAWEFGTDDDSQGWKVENSLTDFNVRDGILKTSITGEDPIMRIGALVPNADFSLDADSYKAVQIRMKAGDTSGALRWLDKNGLSISYAFDLINDDEFHTYTIDFSNAGGLWSGNLNYLRLDPVENASSGDIEIDYIRFLDSMLQPAWEFKTDGDAEEWVPNVSLRELEVSGGTLKTSVVGSDPFMTNSLVNFPASAFGYIQIRMKTTTSGSTAQLYWIKKNAGGVKNMGHENFSIIPDGLFHNYNLDLTKSPDWTDQIIKLRLDPTTVASGDVEVDYIRFSDTPFAETAPTWNFNTAGNAEGWTPHHHLSDFEVRDGKLYTNVTGVDPYLWGPRGYEIDGVKYKTLEIRFAVIGPHIGKAGIFWTIPGGGGFTADKLKIFDIAEDEEFHTYEVNVGIHSQWFGKKITRIRLDPVLRFYSSQVDSGVQVVIDYIRLKE